MSIAQDRARKQKAFAKDNHKIKHSQGERLQHFAVVPWLDADKLKKKALYKQTALHKAADSIK